jgi:hypothetical protein
MGKCVSVGSKLKSQTAIKKINSLAKLQRVSSADLLAQKVGEKITTCSRPSGVSRKALLGGVSQLHLSRLNLKSTDIRTARPPFLAAESQKNAVFPTFEPAETPVLRAVVSVESARRLMRSIGKASERSLDLPPRTPFRTNDDSRSLAMDVAPSKPRRVQSIETLDDSASVSAAADTNLNDKNQHPGLLQVKPGVFKRFRGQAETWTLIQRDFYMSTACPSCSTELCCVQDVDYVWCPNCKSASCVGSGGGGCGIGFTLNDLRLWERDEQQEFSIS